MVLQTTPKAICEYLGHDGSEIIWPELKDPQRRRSFHIQEMIDFCIDNHVFPVCIEPLPCTCPDGESELYDINRINPIEYYLSTRPGVLLGYYEDRRHAVAWDGKDVLDPRGCKYALNEFGIDTFYALY